MYFTYGETELSYPVSYTHLEEQAYPALRQGASQRGHPAGRAGVPHRWAHHRGRAAEDRPVLQRGGGLRHPQRHGVHKMCIRDRQDGHAQVLSEAAVSDRKSPQAVAPKRLGDLLYLRG